jgi:hypothetical protein
MEGAYSGSGYERGNKSEKNNGNHYTYNHSRHSHGKEVPEGRGETEPPILQTHPINETKPEIS